MSRAVANGHLDIVDRLLGIEAVRVNAAAMANVALSRAAANGHLDIVDRLLGIEAVRVNAAAYDNEALRLAAEYGHSDIVRRLARTIWPDSGVNGIPVDIQNFAAGGMTIKAHIERASEKLLFANTLFKYHEKVSSLPGFNSNDESPYEDASGPWGKIKGYLNGPGR